MKDFDYFKEREARSEYPYPEVRFVALEKAYKGKISETGLQFAWFFHKFVVECLHELDAQALGTVISATKESTKFQGKPSAAFRSIFEEIKAEK